jgi:hypothetical protein
MDKSGTSRGEEQDFLRAPETGTGSERRDAGRYRTVCRVAKILRKGEVGLWRVRNMSDTGMMLSADVPIEAGEPLQIALSDDVVLSGHVVWTEKGRCGIELDQGIDCAALLKQLAEQQRAKGYRAPRLEAGIDATAEMDGKAHKMRLVDLSQSGAGFLHDGQYAPGMTLALEIGDGIRRQAIVRWSSETRGGLWLTRPIDRADLESLKRSGAEGDG